MIILHEATDLLGLKRVGYIVKWNNIYYIISGNLSYKIDPNTITPIQQTQSIEAHYLQEYLSSIIGISTIRNFNMRGIYFLEDLCSWTDTDLLSIRGIGKTKLKKIKEILKSFNLI
jgi:DNA-directed RNA polymerase, alpha subunit/40 kD subunit